MDGEEIGIREILIKIWLIEYRIDGQNGYKLLESC